MTHKIENHADILNAMIDQPGMISEAYSQFHNYSLGNIMAVAIQCKALGIVFGPISNYKNWQRLGRQVQKGQKAMVILHPRQRSFVKEEIDENGETVERVINYMTFVAKATAFVLSQTEGDEIEWEQFGWDKDQALAELEINELPFTNVTSGNVQGFARQNGISVNPVAKYPMKTLAHEIAHKLMHIDSETSEIFDGELIKRSDREVEAETVAMIVGEALGLAGKDESIGYIKSWMDEGFVYTAKMAGRILSAANKILKAGRVECEAEDVISAEGETQSPSAYDPDKFDAKSVAQDVLAHFGLEDCINTDVRVKAIKGAGHSYYDHYGTSWVSIPVWAIRRSEEYANYYVAHEMCHQIHWYMIVMGETINGEKARRGRGHCKQFKYLERKVLKALWNMTIKYARAYPKSLSVNGEVVYAR